MYAGLRFRVFDAALCRAGDCGRLPQAAHIKPECKSKTLKSSREQLWLPWRALSSAAARPRRRRRRRPPSPLSSRRARAPPAAPRTGTTCAGFSARRTSARPVGGRQIVARGRAGTAAGSPDGDRGQRTLPRRRSCHVAHGGLRSGMQASSTVTEKIKSDCATSYESMS